MAVESNLEDKLDNLRNFKNQERSISKPVVIAIITVIRTFKVP